MCTFSQMLAAESKLEESEQVRFSSFFGRLRARPDLATVSIELALSDKTKSKEEQCQMLTTAWKAHYKPHWPILEQLLGHTTATGEDFLDFYWTVHPLIRPHFYRTTTS